jgi:hypothetical protein
MRFAWISEQAAIISLYSINLSGFITEAGNVYCAVRPGSLNQTDTHTSLKIKKTFGLPLCLSIILNLFSDNCNGAQIKNVELEINMTI